MGSEMLARRDRWAGLAGRAMVALLVMTLVLALPGEAEADTTDLELTVYSEPSVLRPGDQVELGVVVANPGRRVRGVTVELSVDTRGIELEEVATTATTAGIEQEVDTKAGVVRWTIASLEFRGELDLTISGVVQREVVDLEAVSVTATATDGELEAQPVDASIPPVISVEREVTATPTEGTTTVGGTITVTPNTDLEALVITESLATIDADPRVTPVATRRSENAEASEGRMIWRFPVVEGGQPIELAYQAAYPPSLNLGTFGVTTSGSITEDGSELFFGPEQEHEVRTPLVSVSAQKVTDETTDTPFRRGDQATVSFTVTNGGEPTEVAIDVEVDASAVSIVEAADGEHTDRRVNWVRQLGTGGEATFSYTIEARELFEDREAALDLRLSLGGLEVGLDQTSAFVDTDRRATAAEQWFALILLFMVLGFGVLLWITRTTGDISERTAYVGVVVAILTAVLVLAFGLELGSEATLTLLGAIAGYVLGERRWSDSGGGAGADRGAEADGGGEGG